MKTISFVVALALIAGCNKQYKSRVVMTPEATDRRLSTGKSDVVDGIVKSGDGNAVFVEVDGQMEAIPRGDVLRVDQREAKRDVTIGIIGGIVGVALVAGGYAFMECDENDFPLFCPFHSKSNLWSGVAIIGGIAITGASLRAIFQGLAGQSQTDAAMQSSNLAKTWRVAPTIVVDRDTSGPGIELSRRF